MTSTANAGVLTVLAEMDRIRLMRIMLYCILIFFAFITLVLSALRIHYTTHIRSPDPTNNGIRFYDPVVVLLLVTSILTIFWALFAVRRIYNTNRERQNAQAGTVHPPFFSSFAAELVGLFVVFVLWLVGAAVALHTSNPPQVNVFWADLSSCWTHWQCRTLTAMLAFAWLSWIVVFVLFVTSLLFAIEKQQFRECMDGTDISGSEQLPRVGDQGSDAHVRGAKKVAYET